MLSLISVHGGLAVHIPPILENLYDSTRNFLASLAEVEALPTEPRIYKLASGYTQRLEQNYKALTEFIDTHYADEFLQYRKLIDEAYSSMQENGYLRDKGSYISALAQSKPKFEEIKADHQERYRLLHNNFFNTLVHIMDLHIRNLALAGGTVVSNFNQGMEDLIERADFNKLFQALDSLNQSLEASGYDLDQLKLEQMPDTKRLALEFNELPKPQPLEFDTTAKERQELIESIYLTLDLLLGNLESIRKLAEARDVDTRKKVAKSMLEPEGIHSAEMFNTLINGTAKTIEKIDTNDESLLNKLDRINEQTYLSLLHLIKKYT